MNEMNWAKVVASITPLKPTDLSDIIDALSPPSAKKENLEFPISAGTSPLVGEFTDEAQVCFGARITQDTPNPVKLGMTLAQMAAEKGAYPVILSYVDHTGLEPFGFRVERIGGKDATEMAACEAQILKFWNIVMVI